ncbi:MAG: hypothetical protein H5T41_03620 [Methanomassiliicoccales archaeon]|nr:hypothetical protein [Methanomassiliicoccales archaeon]
MAISLIAVHRTSEPRVHVQTTGISVPHECSQPWIRQPHRWSFDLLSVDSLAVDKRSPL